VGTGNTPVPGGLRGALHNVAVTRNLVEQTEGKIRGAEHLLNRLAFSSDYTLFVIRRVYGGAGNRFRHGRADSGERQRMLYSVAALAGWLDAVNENVGVAHPRCEARQAVAGGVERVAAAAELIT
jgi:hypothetical protein